MLTNQEKAQVLFSLLGDKSGDILNLLSPDSAQILTTSIGNTPEPDSDVLNELALEIIEEIERQKKPVTNSVPPSQPIEKTFDESSLSDSPSDPLGDPFAPTQADSPIQDPIREEAPRSPEIRTASKIASLLMEQKPQIIAFFLSRLDEKLKSEILDHLNDEIKADIEAREVDRSPISDKVFAKLYDKICKKEPGEKDEEVSSGDDWF